MVGISLSCYGIFFEGGEKRFLIFSNEPLFQRGSRLGIGIGLL
jgi:hypothetical protein